MKYNKIDNALYIKNRAKLKSKLDKNSIVILNSNDQMPTNADGLMPFRQNNDLLYLSGVDQEESILVICPGVSNVKHKEILFVKETNDLIAVWEGEKLTKKQATETSGIQTVYWLSEFDEVLRTLMFEAQTVYLNQNEHLRALKQVQTRDDRFRLNCRDKYPLHSYERLAPIMTDLRQVKESEEINLIQQACDITEKGFRRILEFIEPGVMEYEIEAELAHEFLRNRSRGFAYEPIVGGGHNACVLHYLSNNMECKDGDMILLDVGAEYANYASDMTRCVPVNGTFSKRQREVYSSVLRVLNEASSLLVPGNTFEAYEKETAKMIEFELISLGLLDKHDVAKQDAENPLYKKYFMHGTSHHMGLDVHDVVDRGRVFESDMVVTCEPGIYIREENLGIRLENDLLMTNNGPKNLMKNIPIEIEEIEDIMAKSSVLV
jgi:Xaa-Pro aminopeptidase